MVRRTVVGLALAALLLPALALTLARSTDPTWVLAVQYVAFTPAALVLYAVAAVVLAVLARRSTSPRPRRPLVAAAVLVLVPLGVHAAWFAPQVAGAEPSVADDAVPLRVITANLLRGEGEVDDVLTAAREVDADLVVLPEATDRTMRRLERRDAAATWPHVAGEPGRDIEGTVVLSRTPVTDVEHVPTELASWAFDTRVRGRDVSVVAVHPIAPYEGAAGWRRDHATILDAVVEREADVVLGDFNATMDHRPMRRLGEAGLRTATEVANEGWRPTWPVNGLFTLGGVPLPRSAEIDHVMVTDDVAVEGTERHLVAGTDHLALSADLRLR